MKIKSLPPVFAISITSPSLGKEWLCQSDEWSKGSRKTHWMENPFGVNSIIRAAVSQGSGCGASATFSIQREWQWCYKAQDHCSVVAVLSWYSLLSAVGFLLSLPFSFLAFPIWFFNLPKISVSYSIYAVINSFLVLSAITLTTNDPVEVYSVHIWVEKVRAACERSHIPS